jgi:hypothetical protein
MVCIGVLFGAVRYCLELFGGQCSGSVKMSFRSDPRIRNLELRIRKPRG